MPAKLVIHGDLTDLNTYIRDCRANKYSGAQTKKQETERVAKECKAQRLPRFAGPVCASYTIYLKDRKKDWDNVLVYLKWINDGLVAAQVIPNDSMRWLSCNSIQFVVDPGHPRTEVLLSEL